MAALVSDKREGYGSRGEWDRNGDLLNFLVTLVGSSKGTQRTKRPTANCFLSTKSINLSASENVPVEIQKFILFENLIYSTLY